MRIIDGICYADDPRSITEVREIKALPDYKLLCTFMTGEQRLFDFKPYLGYEAFIPLQDESVFKSVTLEHGIPIWMDGTIDFSPDRLLIEGEHL